MNWQPLNQVASLGLIIWVLVSPGHMTEITWLLYLLWIWRFFLERGGLSSTQTHYFSIFLPPLVPKVKFSMQVNINLLFACLIWILLDFWPMCIQLPNFHATVIGWALKILIIFRTFIWGKCFYLLLSPVIHQSARQWQRWQVHGLFPLISPAAYLLAAMSVNSEMVKKWQSGSRSQGAE